MAKRILIHLLLLVLGLTMGALTGGLGYYWYAKHRANATYARLTPADAAHLRTIRNLLFRASAYNYRTSYWSPPKETIHQKLQEQTSGLEQLRLAPGSGEIRVFASVYLTFGYVRLARLEDQSGNKPQAERYMAKAEAECAVAGWKDCSASALRSATETWVRSSAPSTLKVAGDYQ